MNLNRWRSTFRLKDLLTPEDVSDERAIALGREVATRLETSPFWDHTSLARHFEAATDQDSFNAALSILYDRADEQGVWVE